MPGEGGPAGAERADGRRAGRFGGKAEKSGPAGQGGPVGGERTDSGRAGRLPNEPVDLLLFVEPAGPGGARFTTVSDPVAYDRARPRRCRITTIYREVEFGRRLVKAWAG